MDLGRLCQSKMLRIKTVGLNRWPPCGQSKNLKSVKNGPSTSEKALQGCVGQGTQCITSQALGRSRRGQGTQCITHRLLEKLLALGTAILGRHAPVSFWARRFGNSEKVEKRQKSQ